MGHVPEGSACNGCGEPHQADDAPCGCAPSGNGVYRVDQQGIVFDGVQEELVSGSM